MVIVTEDSADPAQTSQETKAILRFALQHVSVVGWDTVQGALFSAWLNVAFDKGGQEAVLRDLNHAIANIERMSQTHRFAHGLVSGLA
jgi:hypothetical protein